MVIILTLNEDILIPAEIYVSNDGDFIKCVMGANTANNDHLFCDVAAPFISNIEYIDNGIDEILLLDPFMNEKEYYNTDLVLHNPCGPAIIRPPQEDYDCPIIEYWLNGEKYTKQKWSRKTKNK